MAQYWQGWRELRFFSIWFQEATADKSGDKTYSSEGASNEIIQSLNPCEQVKIDDL